MRYFTSFIHMAGEQLAWYPLMNLQDPKTSEVKLISSRSRKLAEVVQCFLAGKHVMAITWLLFGSLWGLTLETSAVSITASIALIDTKSIHQFVSRHADAVKLVLLINPFTPESDQCQNSPAESQEIWHHTVWRTWLFIAYSDEKWLYYKFSLHHSYNRFLKGWENGLFELRSERVQSWHYAYCLVCLVYWFVNKSSRSYKSCSMTPVMVGPAKLALNNMAQSYTVPCPQNCYPWGGGPLLHPQPLPVERVLVFLSLPKKAITAKIWGAFQKYGSGVKRDTGVKYILGGTILYWGQRGKGDKQRGTWVYWLYILGGVLCICTCILWHYMYHVVP